VTTVSIEALATMAGCVVVYWALPARIQLLFASALTAGIVGWLSPASLALLAPLTLICFVSGRARWLRRRAPLGVAILVVCGFAAYRVLLRPDVAPEAQTVVLLGFAFYALRALHYVIELDRGGHPPHRLEDFVAYMFFLPTFTAGPIHRFPDFKRELRRRRFDPVLFAEGLERVLFGYAKVVLLGNWLVSTRLANYTSQLEPDQAGLIAYLECVTYGANLYFQFAGYSDIAVGFARLLGIRVMENFNWPFLRQNISEFWNCWHISLSSWCRDYVFMPVVARTRTPVLAVLSSMLVLGLWHEFTARYVLWALYHGLGIVGWRSFQDVKRRFGLALDPIESPRLAAAVQGASVLVTVNFVMLSFAITKETDVMEGLRVYRDIFTGGY
jgi:alginate O-acetyltransferase complex protein AlgI